MGDNSNCVITFLQTSAGNDVFNVVCAHVHLNFSSRNTHVVNYQHIVHVLHAIGATHYRFVNGLIFVFGTVLKYRSLCVPCRTPCIA